jgi:hypothetical protein
MRDYHKIQTVFQRDVETKFKKIKEGVWSMPEFELLKDIEWVWTEKIDGTNIRIMWDGEIVRFGGKTENAQIPTHLLKELQDIFTVEKMKKCFPDATGICLYGEGYGVKIQKGSNYIPGKTDFILFDCRIGNWWLTRESLEEIAEKLNIGIVPIIGRGTLLDAVHYVKQGFKSVIAHNKDYIAEGLIMKPGLELFNRKGERIIAKIKYKDFHER